MSLSANKIEEVKIRLKNDKKIFGKKFGIVKVTKHEIRVGTNVIPIDHKRGTNTVIPMKCLMTLLVNDKLIPYENNRGEGALKIQSVKNVQKDYDPTFLGAVSISWSDDNKCFVLADSHHRILGLMYRILDGNTSLKELNDNICLCIGRPNSHLLMYKGLNKCSRHGSKENSSNIDFAIGYELKRIYEKLPSEQVDFFKTELTTTFFSNAIRNHVYTFIKEGTTFVKEAYWPDIWSKSTEALTFSKCIADENYSLTDEQVNIIVEALDFYYKVFNHPNFAINDLKVRGKIIKSHPLFAILVQQHINNKQFQNGDLELPKSAGVIARALTRNSSEILDYLGSMAKGTVAKVESKFYHFPRLFRP